MSKTHWRKNNDKRYISGEDLKHGLEINKGLKPEMNVIIVGFEDSKTYDQNANVEVVKTGLFMQEINGNKLYKPVILNNTNGAFLAKEFNSEFMEDWVNKPIVLYAQADRRHGFVARFRKYIDRSLSPENALRILNASTTIQELQSNWSSLTKEEQALTVVAKRKDELKTTLK